MPISKKGQIDSFEGKVINAHQIHTYTLDKTSACFIIAEIGINHNGSLETAKELILAAKKAGCNAVKFQKRTIEIVYSKEELARERQSPFGSTNGDLKYGLEFSYEDYKEIDRLCKELDIIWFASPWDEQSVDFLEQFNVPCYKVAAASMTDRALLESIKRTKKPVFMSTGMSSEAEIDRAVQCIGLEQLILMHCVSLYPAPENMLNLRAMKTLMNKYPVLVGYSGHEYGTLLSTCAVAMGAVAVERHFTLDRDMWGSDQKASINPQEMSELVQNIRLFEESLGSPLLQCLKEEEPVKEKLRRVSSV